MGLPRDDVVFRLRQCDKENHGWREGPPLTGSCQSFDLLAGPSPSRQNQLRTKKEYYLPALAARSSIRTLAGLKRRCVNVAACVCAPSGESSRANDPVSSVFRSHRWPYCSSQKFILAAKY